MKKSTKIALILALCLTLAGAILFSIVMTALGWDFTRLATVRYAEVDYTVREAVTEVSVRLSTADVTFLPSDDGILRVECTTDEANCIVARAEGDVLIIEKSGTTPWYSHVGIDLGGETVTVYLPEKAYTSVNVRLSTGDLTLKDISAEEIELELSTGKATLENIECRNLTSSASTGDIELTGVISEEMMTIKRSTGNVTLVSCDAAELQIETGTGDVSLRDIGAEEIEFKLSTGKATLENIECRNLSTTATTGNIELTRVISEEMMTVKRSTGNVTLVSCDAAELQIETSTGDVSGTLLSPKTFATKTDTGFVLVPEGGMGGKCAVCTTTGDIEFTIEK